MRWRQLSSALVLTLQVDHRNKRKKALRSTLGNAIPEGTTESFLVMDELPTRAPTLNMDLRKNVEKSQILAT